MSSPLIQFKDWKYSEFAALGTKLGGPEVARKLLSCQRASVNFIDSGNFATITADPPAWEVWQTIKIGTGVKSGKAFCSELEKKKFRIGDWASDILKQDAFTVATQEEDVDLVNLSVADLGFKKGARYDAICIRALELGLELCPAEVGPQLRLQYPDQPRDKWLVVAMDALRDSNGNLRVFVVVHGSAGRWLHTCDGHPDSFFDGDLRFVFRLPRKQPVAA